MTTFVIFGLVVIGICLAIHLSMNRVPTIREVIDAPHEDGLELGERTGDPQTLAAAAGSPLSPESSVQPGGISSESAELLRDGSPRTYGK